MTGFAVLFAGVALGWSAAPGRWPSWLEASLPAGAVRLLGLLAVVGSARWFVGGSGWFAGSVELLVCLSLAASAVALAGPLRPRAAPVAAACAAVLAVVLELAR